MKKPKLKVELRNNKGKEANKKFRREGIKTPILMYTSISKTVGMEFGAGEMVPVDAFVEKPISSEELIEKVKNLLK